MEQKIEKVFLILSEICGVDKEHITMDLSLEDDMGITSVSFVETLARIEQEFEMELGDNAYDITRYKTVEDIANIVNNTK